MTRGKFHYTDGRNSLPGVAFLTFEALAKMVAKTGVRPAHEGTDAAFGYAGYGQAFPTCASGRTVTFSAKGYRRSPG